MHGAFFFLLTTLPVPPYPPTQLSLTCTYETWHYSNAFTANSLKTQNGSLPFFKHTSLDLKVFAILGIA